MKLTFLGTGTSSGVPVLGCHCAVCDSSDPRDKRFRTAALLEEGDVRILIDAGPDIRMQLMPFPEIQQRIRENFIFGYAWSDEISTRIRELTITRVSLSCAIAQLPDQTDEAILVPAWVVTYRSDRSEITHAYDLLMVINAIDGSYLFVN